MLSDLELTYRPFCRDCLHCNVNPTLKLIYNKYVKEAFTNCPETFEKVAGCFSKNIEVNWENFESWCVANKMMDKLAE